MSRITRLCRRCMFDAGSGPSPRPRRHPLAAVSASSVGSLANHSLCNCEAVLRQYGGGRLLAQSITMRRVYRADNQQTQLLLPRLRRPSKWGITVRLAPNDIAFRKCYLSSYLSARLSGDVNSRHLPPSLPLSLILSTSTSLVPFLSLYR